MAMKLMVLGSSSKGNCYIFDDGEQCLIVECGIALKQVQIALDWDMSRIAGVLISHEHFDHSACANTLAKRQLPLFASHGTLKALKVDNSAQRLLFPLESLKTAQIGNFKVMPFDTEHDASQPFGFVLYHPQMGKTLFATDTHYLRYTFSGLSNIMIECNYRKDILDWNVAHEVIHPALAERTMRSHMEYNTCLEALMANDLSEVNNIVLLHLSNDNSAADEFKRGIAEATLKTTYIATPGLTINNFNKTPF